MTSIIKVHCDCFFQSTNTGKDIFSGIVPMCKQHHEIIKKVFANPEQVMTKFLLNIYQLKLNQYAQTRLEDRKNEDKYLKTLFDLYSRTMKLSQDLAEFNLSTDEFDLLSKLSQNIFAPHLVTYIDTEAQVLENKCMVVQKKFYEGKNHQKKRAERFQDFKRDVQANVQALMGNRGGQQQQQADENSGETLLSEELAINLLQEAKAAFKRCRVVRILNVSVISRGRHLTITPPIPVESRERSTQERHSIVGYSVAVLDEGSRGLRNQLGSKCDPHYRFQGLSSGQLSGDCPEDEYHSASAGEDLLGQYYSLCGVSGGCLATISTDTQQTLFTGPPATTRSAPRTRRKSWRRSN